MSERGVGGTVPRAPRHLLLIISSENLATDRGARTLIKD